MTNLLPNADRIDDLSGATHLVRVAWKGTLGRGTIRVLGALLIAGSSQVKAIAAATLLHAALTGGGGGTGVGNVRLDTVIGSLGGAVLSRGDDLRLRPGFAGQLNEGPSAEGDTVKHLIPDPLSLEWTVPLGNDTDAEGDSLVVVSAGPDSSAGGTVQIVGSTIVYTPPANLPLTDTFTYTITDGFGMVGEGLITVSRSVARVVGQYVFYGLSAFDSGHHDAAIAPDKTALRTGRKATFANYTSYSRGLNGIMIDVLDLGGDPTAADFGFRVGNVSDVTTWRVGQAAASVGVRRGEGVAGSDRITLTWGADAVTRNWLEVRLLATVRTGLAGDDVFYFGNAIGEAGDSPGTNAVVNATDEILARANPRGLFVPAAIDFPYDYDRDRQVNATDRIIARSNTTSAFTALQLITPSALSTGVDGLTASLAGIPAGAASGAGNEPERSADPPVAGGIDPGPSNREGVRLRVRRLGDGRVRVESSGPLPENAQLEVSDRLRDGVWERVTEAPALGEGGSRAWLVSPGTEAEAFFFRWVRPAVNRQMTENSGNFSQ